MPADPAWLVPASLCWSVPPSSAVRIVSVPPRCCLGLGSKASPSEPE